MEENSNFRFNIRDEDILAGFYNLWTKRWCVEDVIWMLFGDHGLAIIGSVRTTVPIDERKSDYRITDIFNKFLQAIQSGRFGTFYENDLEALRFLPVHPLKVIDWFEDEEVLELVKSYAVYKLHPGLYELIGKWNRDREAIKPHKKDPLERFVKAELVARREFRAMLFGELYAHEYQPLTYHKFNPAIEAMMREVDHHIDEGLALGRIKTTGFDLDFGVIKEPALLLSDLLTEIKFKGYLVPEGLIEAKEEGDWDKAEKLLEKLQENMRVYIECGGKIDKAKFKKLTRANDGKSKSFVQDWGQVKIVALREGDIETSVTGNILSLQEIKDLGLTKGNIAFLYNIALKGKFFDKTFFPNDRNLGQSVKRLNESLRIAFQINEDPITYNKQAKGYQVSFQTESDPSE